MNQTYPIMGGDQQIGSAVIREEGLYTLFTCRCSFADQGIHRVYVRGDNGGIDLGVCYPEQGYFSLKKKIPTKVVPKGNLMFYCDSPAEEMILWKEGQKQMRIHALKNAKALRRETLIMIKMSTPNQPDSDQSP